MRLFPAHVCFEQRNPTSPLFRRLIQQRKPPKPWISCGTRARREKNGGRPSCVSKSSQRPSSVPSIQARRARGTHAPRRKPSGHAWTRLTATRTACFLSDGSRVTQPEIPNPRPLERNARRTMQRRTKNDEQNDPATSPPKLIMAERLGPTPRRGARRRPSIFRSQRTSKT